MVNKLVSGVIVVAALVMAGCAPNYGPVAAYDGTLPTGVSPRLQRGDKIKVTVYGEDNLNGVYEIDPQARASMPLAGQIWAAGRTKMELQSEIGRKLKSEYLQVSKSERRGRRLSAGLYPRRSRTSRGEFPISSRIEPNQHGCEAGGFTYRASRSTVLIKHADEDVWHEYPITTHVVIDRAI